MIYKETTKNGIVVSRDVFTVEECQNYLDDVFHSFNELEIDSWITELQSDDSNGIVITYHINGNKMVMQIKGNESEIAKIEIL